MAEPKTYFEILGLDETVTSEDTIQEAYNRAQIRFQTILNQGIGEQAQFARQMMDGELQNAYETLIDSTKRQQYRRSLELAREQGDGLSGAGNVQVKFSLGGGHGDYTFMVVENPVRHALNLYGNLSVNSIQEYICRAWEDPELSLEFYSDRSLERWIYYSAGDLGIANAIRYFKWAGSQLPINSLMYQALDLLQTRYAVPILPRSPSDLLDRIADFEKPRWDVAPRVINFGLIPQGKVSVPVFIRWWKKRPGKIVVKTDNPIFQLNIGKLNSDLQFSVDVDGASLKRGDVIRGQVTITSDNYGEVQLFVVGARYKMMGNTTFAQEINLMAAKAAMSVRDFETASRTYRIAGAAQEGKTADLEVIRIAYKNHEWMRVIEKIRQFHSRYGRMQETLAYLIEAARVVGGTHYQLRQYERSLEYLATLAYETAYLPEKRLPSDNWTVSEAAQIRLKSDDPKSDWINIAETLNLRWTHGEGNADQSKYAGPMPLDLKPRNVVWLTGTANYKPPIVAYEGVLVVRSKDNRAIVGLDAASGQVLWQHTQGLNGRDISAPVAGNSSVYITDPAGVLYCLDILSGTIKWRVQLKDSRDLSLALEDPILCVGTGSQVLLVNSQNGSEIASTKEMRGFFGGGANPVNILLTDGCCLFQKAVFGKQSMVFLDMENGNSLEFDIPYSLTPPVTWAAYEGHVYIPLIVTKEMRCKYHDSEGKVREKTEIVWSELDFSVYGVRSNRVIASLETPIGRYPTQLPGGCRILIKNVQQASSCAVAPVYTEKSGDTTIVSPPQEGKYLHRMVAASFGRDVYYWLVTESAVSVASYRRSDSNVQSILFANVHDMVVSATSLSTSLAGNTTDDDASTFVLPESVRPIIGTPALYGDIIYLVSRTGQVVAVGR
ncbi:MAG: PQQ-binding-like beta-propeller repeat protein [Chloroflexi bacterium]|jgi:hypothetical protein|nr:PQQ-binding-like beta-propeller repeat protein [Chloroflexota bacterium]